jgi:hypothetical protein
METAVGPNHRSKCALGLAAGFVTAAVAAAAATPGCRKDPDVTLRAVTMHASCSPAPDALARAIFHALGDYEPPPAALDGHPALAVGDALPEVDPAARAVFVDATEGAQSWWGVTSVPPSGPVDVWLLPALTSCAAFPAPGPEGAAPPARDGAAMAAIAGQRVLVVGGGGRGKAPPTLVVRLDTGGVDAAAPDLLTPRTGASVTPFGTGALVAGGSDSRGVNAPLGSAEVYDATVGGFDQQNLIALSEPRAAHGAAVLVTGETLLVGGVGADGHTLLDTMEVVDPATRTVRSENVALLAAPRSSPTVLRLASGEILVAGGFDAQGAPVPTLEWFAPDASTATKRPRDLVSGAARSFVALDAGGALAVIAPAAGASPGFDNVWVIDADGGLEAATSIAGALTQPVLFGGAGGAPALWTGDRWLRWEPWTGSFGALGVLDVVPANVSSVAAAADPGLAMWLDATTWAVTALRFDTRGTYSTLTGALLVDDATDVAPDRLPDPAGAAFDPAQGLTLAPGASAFVTDRTYADVAVDVDAPTGQPALVVLRDDLANTIEVGGSGCGGVPLSGATSVHVERRGTSVAWRLSSGASGECAAGVATDARVSLGVRGAPPGPSVVRNIRVTRLGSP